MARVQRGLESRFPLNEEAVQTDCFFRLTRCLARSDPTRPFQGLGVSAPRRSPTLRRSGIAPSIAIFDVIKMTIFRILWVLYGLFRVYL